MMRIAAQPGWMQAKSIHQLVRQRDARNAQQLEAGAARNVEQLEAGAAGNVEQLEAGAARNAEQLEASEEDAHLWLARLRCIRSI